MKICLAGKRAQSLAYNFSKMCTYIFNEITAVVRKITLFNDCIVILGVFSLIILCDCVKYIVFYFQKYFSSQSTDKVVHSVLQAMHYKMCMHVSSYEPTIFMLVSLL